MGRKSVVVPAAIEVLRQYDSRVTIRQLYTLEAIIENAIKEQVNFDIREKREKEIEISREWIELQVSEYLVEQDLGDA